MENLISLKEASVWASDYLCKKVSTSNISYLVQYGRIKKYTNEKKVLIDVIELKKYYENHSISKETTHKEKFGEELNWALSFDNIRESETTKHVHRLHPYKGKFIPQLVEYFLDEHIDEFKKEKFFNKYDTVLDPFSGSGTTLVQAAELGIHSIGIDISEFNCLISNCKVNKHDLSELQKYIDDITSQLDRFVIASNILLFDKKLLDELSIFNNKFFPVPKYKYEVRNKIIDEKEYAFSKEVAFLPIYQKLVKDFNINITCGDSDSFLEQWFIGNIRNELHFVKNLIDKIPNEKARHILYLLLSRTMRSCRATTHSDLATLLSPVNETYYCKKHGKICKPLFSILKWWKSYSKDLLKRLSEFEGLKKDVQSICINGDSRSVNILNELKNKNAKFYKKIEQDGIQGIFSSPPYVGVIDYHEQHAYAYDLFNLERKDESEIGPLYKGQGKAAQKSYIEGISSVLINCKQYLAPDFNIFLVANDKYGLYPSIAEAADLRIVNQYLRPVLNRTEKDKNAYSEIIFHLKKK